MKSSGVLILIGMLFCGMAFAESYPESSSKSGESKTDSEIKRSQSDTLSADPFFVVEAGEETSSESLNRISGKYDLGFSGPSQSYKSESQYHAGPLGRKEPGSNGD